MLALDLFAGAGGASLGLARAGYSVTGVDAWNVAVESQRLNGLTCVQADVQTCAEAQGWTEGQYDLLWASPPCQPWSQAGRQQGVADTRDCMPAAFKMAALLRPRVFIVENSKSIGWDKHTDYRNFLASFLPADYRIDHKILDFSRLGVAQSRKRWIFIARLDAQPVWPELSSQTTMADKLGWENKGSPYRTVGKASIPVTVPNGGDAKWVFERPAMTVVGTFRPEYMAGPGWRKAGDGPRQRAAGTVEITLEEAKLLQDFPRDYRLAGTIKQQWLQVGNAVPPSAAQRLAEANA